MRTEATIEAALAATGQKASLAGAGTTGFAWFLSNEFLGLAGFLIAALGLLVNIYYRRKENDRRQALHEATLAALKTPGAAGLAAALSAAPSDE